MSLLSVLTALGDKIRTLSGATNKMSIETMTTQVDEANTEIDTQAELIGQIKTALQGKWAGFDRFPQFLGRTIVEITANDFGGVTEIGNYAFQHQYKLMKITIPNTITKIGTYAFWSCVGLKELTIPDSVTTLGGWCFSYLSKLESIKLPSNITTLPEGALAHALKLAYLEIPEKVTSIGAYQQCGADVGGATIAVRAIKPPTLNSNVYWNTSNTKKIIVPQGTLSAYKSATNWSTLASLMEESTEW